MAWAARLPKSSSLVIADPSGFAAAFGALIDRGLAGAPRDILILPVNPRLAVLETAFASLQQQSASPDALFRGLEALAMGNLSINGQTQGALEEELLGQHAAGAFQDLTLMADRVFFRSFHELERSVAQYRYRPARTHIFTPADPGVPAAHADRLQQAESHIAVWAVASSPALVAAFKAVCFDLRAPLTFIDTVDERTSRTLAGASLIVALSTDPGTVYALADYGKPLCAPVCGAAEIIGNLREFQPWNRVEILDAVLAAPSGGAAKPLAPAARLEIPQDLPARVFPVCPPVTIVMPTFSRPHTLREGLQRLQGQTYPNIEIIVVNNAGTPVNEVVAAFPNVRLIDRTVNTGNATRPRNDGIAAANGTYVTFLDDDDILFPDHVARMVRTLEMSGADAAYSDFLVRFVERGEDGHEAVWGWDIQKPFGITSYELLVANRLGYFTVFMRKSLIEKIGPFAEEVLGGEEVEYWLRIAKHVDFIHVAQPSSAYTVVRDWRGQLSEKSHALYAGGYEMVYERYPAEHLPLVRQMRANYVASLRATETPPPMQPRYLIGTR